MMMMKLYNHNSFLLLHVFLQNSNTCTEVWEDVLVTSIRAYENIKALKYTILSYKTVMQHDPEW